MSCSLSRATRLLAAGIALFAALTAALFAAGAADARAPHAPRSFGASIEDLAPYVGQTSCDPHVKRGTAELGALLARTYRGTTWNSAYKCGTDGSQSEHYEGRAIDWMVSARNHAQYLDGRDFYRWLLATDSRGNRFAMARRLGVMYVIFNNRMWGAWDGKWQNYNGCMNANRRSHSYDNACHRTHMHISLSWNGARGRTTFWTGHVAATDWGPCKVRGHKYAPAWKRVNLAGCPSS